MKSRPLPDQYQVSMNVLRAFDEVRVDDDHYSEDGYTRAKTVRLTVRGDGVISFTIVWRKRTSEFAISHKSKYEIQSQMLAGVVRRRAKAAA